MAKRANGEKLGKISAYLLFKKSRFYYYLFLVISVFIAGLLCAQRIKSDLTLGKPILPFGIATYNYFLQFLFIFLISIILYVFFAILFLNRILNKEYAAIHQKYINLSDIVGYTSILESFWAKKLDKNARIMVNNNLACAYMDLGKFDHSIYLLKEMCDLIKINYNKIQISGLSAMNNLVEVNCVKGDLEQAQYYFSKFLLYESKIKRTIFYGKFIDLKGALEHQINVLSGNISLQDETFFLKDFDKRNPKESMHARFYLALIYAASGNIIKQKECLENIINNDNKLYIVKKAKNILDELNENQI